MNWLTATSPLPTGRTGTRRTLEAMRVMARRGAMSPIVIKAAQDVVSGVPERDDRATISALMGDVRSRMRYTPDPLDVELVKDPATVVRNTSADPFGGSPRQEPMDCDDASVLLSAYLGAVGIPSRFKAVAADPRRRSEFSHVYVMARLRDGTWVPADPIVRDWDVGSEVPKEHQYSAPMELAGALGGLDDMPNNDGVNRIADDLASVGTAYVNAKYGPATKSPSLPLVQTPVATSSTGQFLNEWLNPLGPTGINLKAVVVWGAVGFAAWQFFKRRSK